MTTITVSDLRHTYQSTAHTGAVPALAGVSFTVPTGQLVCVVGPSGCGKSTLLVALAGQLVPDDGTITFDDHPGPDARPTVAIVPQDYRASLAPWLTAQGNVELPLRRRTITRTDRRERARQALDEVGLSDRHRSLPGQLSGGMAQRVALARALAVRPALLLMDEPFASVDAQTRFELEDLLLRVRAEHTTTRHPITTVLVTHDLDEAVYLGDRVLVLSGNPTTVLDDVVIDLPATREQILTRQTAAFVAARTHIARLLIPAVRPIQRSTEDDHHAHRP